MKTERTYNTPQRFIINIKPIRPCMDFIDQMLKILEEKLMESSFGTQEFSKSMGLSRMQLHRKLKALTGLSTSHFLKLQRLDVALQLLESTDINISQVGYSVGFNDHSYFSKNFKETYHCTPSDYIKKLAS